MSAIDIVLQIAKKLQKSELRQAINREMRQLQGIIPYLGARGRFQFSSYLKAHQEREISHTKLASYSEALGQILDNVPLSEEQLRILSCGDIFLKTINRALVDYAIKVIGGCGHCIDPYASPELPVIHHHSESTASMEVRSILSEVSTEIDNLAKEFIANPSLIVVASTDAKLRELGPGSPRLDEMPNALHVYIQEIYKQALKPNASDLDKLIGRIPLSESPETQIMRLLASLFCLRHCIQSVDSILYDAFIHDKPIILNEDNISHVVSRGSNRIGQYIDIHTIPLNRNPPDYAGCIAILKAPDGVERYEAGPALIVSHTHKGSAQMGHKNIMKLYYLDRYLNPYSGIAS